MKYEKRGRVHGTTHCSEVCGSNYQQILQRTLPAAGGQQVAVRGRGGGRWKSSCAENHRTTNSTGALRKEHCWRRNRRKHTRSHRANYSWANDGAGLQTPLGTQSASALTALSKNPITEQIHRKELSARHSLPVRSLWQELLAIHRENTPCNRGTSFRASAGRKPSAP